MLKLAANLSPDYEYYIGWTGQSNARPWGSKAEGRSYFDDFDVELVGYTLPTDSLIFGANSRSVGSTEVVTASPAELNADQWIGCKLRLAATTAGTTALLTKGYAQVIENSAGTITIRWLVLPAVGSGVAFNSAGYFIRDDFKWATYPQVRVLVPYQPTSDDINSRIIPYPTANGVWDPFALGSGVLIPKGQGLQLPAPYSVPAGVTSFEDLGLFLDFTFAEGIAGFGISELTSSNGSGTRTMTATTASSFTLSSNTDVNADAFVDGWVVLDWADDSGGAGTGVMKRSWGRILSNTAAATPVFTLTNVGWLGAGTPTGTPAYRRFTVWVPHFNDNPHSYLGDGFNYPNNEMQPGGFPNGSFAGVPIIRNKPRGLSNEQYGDRFGDMLVAASRLSSAIGKRINVVLLGVNSSSLGPNSVPTTYATDAIVGWYNRQNTSTWDPAISTSLYHRVIRLISMVTNALLAEGSTKTAKCLGWVHLQGEGDALLGSARQHYLQSVRAFVTGIRNAIDAAGHNPYSNGAKIPFVQPRIMHLPYEIRGTVTYYGVPVTVDGDSEGRINSAIIDQGQTDGFGGTIYTDDLPRFLPDSGHCNGVGEAERGARLADRLGSLIEFALQHGPANGVLVTPPPRIIEICNVALRLIGQTSSITSLDDGSAEAMHCKALLPHARDVLLQVRQWDFATKRVRLDKIRRPDQFSYVQFTYCYVRPYDALNAFAVLPPKVEEDDFDSNRVLDSGYSATFAANRGHADPVTLTEDTWIAAVEEQPQPYAVEASPWGGRYIFTNQRQAILRYTARVLDADAWSDAFVAAVEFHMASLLASAIIKGDVGEQVAARMRKRTAEALGLAAISDANQQKTVVAHIPDFLADR